MTNQTGATISIRGMCATAPAIIYSTADILQFLSFCNFALSINVPAIIYSTGEILQSDSQTARWLAWDAIRELEKKSPESNWCQLVWQPQRKLSNVKRVDG